MRTIYFEKNIPKILLTMALRSLWPGVVFSPLSPSRLANMPDPALPGPRWVRVRNLMCGVCASDLHLLFARTAPQVGPAALPGTERIYLGHEVVGEIVEVGDEVTAVQPGDRVIMDAHGINCVNQEIDPPCRHCRAGNYSLCENTSVGRGPHGVGGGWSDGFTAHEIGVYRVPDALDNDTAMMIEPLSVGVRTVMRRLPLASERVLIVGCGTIGLATIGAARALSPDCHITAMARYPQQIEMARKMGADEIIAQEDPYKATARISGGKLYSGMFNARMILGGFDAVYDCVGTQKTVQNCLRWARAGGTVVLAGVSLEKMHIDLTPVWYQEVDLLGLYGHGMEIWHGNKTETYDLVVSLLQQSKLDSSGWITHRFPLARWQSAVRTAMDKQSGAIKVVLSME